MLHAPRALEQSVVPVSPMCVAMNYVIQSGNGTLGLRLSLAFSSVVESKGLHSMFVLATLLSFLFQRANVEQCKEI